MNAGTQPQPSGSALRIEHSDAEGTLLVGTSRGDGTAEVVKALGWRWGRSIDRWFVPRSRAVAPKRELIRRTAEALEASGHEVEVLIDSTPQDRAQVEARRAEQATTRAAHLQDRASAHHDRAQQAWAAGDELADRIPFGQPILVGHHSQRRAERDAARIRRSIDQAAEHHRRAVEDERAAQAASAVADARQAPVTVANRVRRLETEIRQAERRLQDADVDSDWAQSVRDHLDHARTDLEYWQRIRTQQIADGTATDYGRDTVKAGDEVKIRGGWYRVARANLKTVTVQTEHSWTQAAPWHEVQYHRPRAAQGT
jgi:Domain of unknown function (DUF3560)